MVTIDGKTDPWRVLQEFYKTRGIGETNLTEKLRAMNQSVIIPYFPYGTRAPTLYELENQYLKDKDVL